MLVVSDNPLSDQQRGDGFVVGQSLFLADRTNVVRATGMVADVEDGIARLVDLRPLRTDEVFEAKGTAILAKAIEAPNLGLRKLRDQQQQFRDEVLARCEYRCVLSGCDVPEALEAAHLPGRSWERGHNSGTDGIALRADLHRLLDTGLLTINFEGMVECKVAHYLWLNGKRITI